jgi:DNA-binding response OmpR family regulator
VAVMSPFGCGIAPLRSPRAPTVDNVILRLRRKLPEPDVIETVRSVGFRLASAE